MSLLSSPSVHFHHSALNSSGKLHSRKQAGLVVGLPFRNDGTKCLRKRIVKLRRTQVNKYLTFVVKSANSVALEKMSEKQTKKVWIWTESKEVMTSAVERGWSTFIFSSSSSKLADEWSSMALIRPYFIDEGELLDGENRKIATMVDVSSPQDLEQLQPNAEQADSVIVNLLGWQVIPAENMVAAFQGSQKTLFAIARTSSEAQIFFEALETGLGGVVLKVDDVCAVFELKDYFDRRNEITNVLSLTRAFVTRVQTVGMGDRVCVDLCSLMKPGEGLMVGSFARGLFLVHSECLESNYIASRPFRVNAVKFWVGFTLVIPIIRNEGRLSVFQFPLSDEKIELRGWFRLVAISIFFLNCKLSITLSSFAQGPVHAYVLVPGGKTCYLAELKAGKEAIIVDQKGSQRTAIVGRVKIETRPLILVEAKEHSDSQTLYSILLQNAETVALVPPAQDNGLKRTAIPVSSLKVGDEVLLRLQGGARHTGIEIQEFIVEN